MPRTKAEPNMKIKIFCPFNVGYNKKSYTVMEVVNPITLERAPVTHEYNQPYWQPCFGNSCPYYDIELHKCNRIETERSNNSNDIVNTISKTYIS